jgi:hypothetical protein
MLRCASIFLGVFLIASIGNAVVWNYIFDGVVYYKAPFFSIESLDYIFVGDWIREDAVTVSSIDHSWTFKHPQQVLEGWNNKKLMMAWSLMFGLSLAVSILISWSTGRRLERRAEQVGATPRRCPKS